MFQSSNAEGVWLASASMYMLSVPGTSTSQADGISSFDIMLITVQGTTPKYSSIDVQHCTALIVTGAVFIQFSITAPSFAIFSSASSGIPCVVTYFLIADSFACAASSLSFIRLMRPKISDRSIVSVVVPRGAGGRAGGRAGGN